MTPDPPSRESRYAWRGVDAQGVPRRGQLIAQDAEQVRAALRRDKITVLELLNKGAARQQAVAAADVTLFSRQLAGLLQAGLPLLAGLELMARSQARPHVARMIAAVARDVVAGTRLAAALHRHPQSFGPLYCRLVALGEASGTLATALTRLADDRERRAAQQAKLRAALAYPAGVLLLALAITAALLIWVVPTFAQIFADVGAALPAPTRFVLALSSAAAHAALPAALALAAAVLAVRAALRRSPALRLQVDRARFKPPVAGPLLRQLCVARWSRALSTLLSAGTPLADVFDTLAHTTGNSVFDRATGEIGAALRRGERLASAMRSAGCFPADVIQLVAVAEEAGSLDIMLANLATFNDKQVDQRIAALSGLIEPLTIVLLGALVGGLVIAMYLPIIQLGNVM